MGAFPVFRTVHTVHTVHRTRHDEKKGFFVISLLSVSEERRNGSFGAEMQNTLARWPKSNEYFDLIVCSICFFYLVYGAPYGASYVISGQSVR